MLLMWQRRADYSCCIFLNANQTTNELMQMLGVPAQFSSVEAVGQREAKHGSSVETSAATVRTTDQPKKSRQQLVRDIQVSRS
jgi:hypothetical protein